MNFHRYKILSLNLLLFSQLFIGDLYKPKRAFSTEDSNRPTSDYIRQRPHSSSYILGPGDVMRLEVKGEQTKELNKIITINGEGMANLKRLKRVYASGLTIDELTDILNKEYSQYVKDPDVELVMISYRPIKIYIDGEVQNPGLHVLNGSFSPTSLIDENVQIDVDKGLVNKKSTQTKLKEDVNIRPIDLDGNTYFPTAIDAIRKSGGVTMYADLTNIKVTRINSISKGSGRLGSTINLLDTLDLKDSSQNIRLYDGDTLLIAKNDKPVIAQIGKAIKSNINPRFIKVYVGGRVADGGSLTVSKSAVLTDAIDLSGGSKVLKGPVRFLRYNNDGTIDRRRFSFNQSAARGSFQNPYLRNGDVIFVGRSAFNIATEVITEVTSPFQGLYSTYRLFELIRN